jgi:hypothetical protein
MRIEDAPENFCGAIWSEESAALSDMQLSLSDGEEGVIFQLYSVCARTYKKNSLTEVEE